MLEDQIVEQVQRTQKEPAAILLRGGNRDRLRALVDRLLSLQGLGRDNVDVDVHFFALPPDEKSLGVEAARDISNVLSRPPLRSPKRTVVVEDTETLTVAAGNALLKPIEELGKLSTHRVIFTALTTNDWPSPLISRFLIYDLHKAPLPSLESKFSAILRQQDKDLESFWNLHEDTLYEVMDIILKIRSYSIHDVMKRMKEMKVLEENPHVFVTGLVQALLHVDLYLRNLDTWKMSESYRDLAIAYGKDYKTPIMRYRLIEQFIAVRDWSGRGSLMGSPQNHIIAAVMQSRFHV